VFAYLKGIVTCKSSDSLVIEANGIGYKINTAWSTLERIGSLGEEAIVHTYLHVREDIMALYGFLTTEELGVFNMLLSVSGIGPKVAISILSTISASKFGLAVITEDAKSLSKAPGVGNKMAQRIILELKDKVKKEQIDLATNTNCDLTVTGCGSIINEAVSALMVLGYSSTEANKAVAEIHKENMDLEDIIKKSLKYLSR
jgi:holliday junction DNA helicase RuvA